MQSSRYLLSSFRAFGAASRSQARFLSTTAPRALADPKNRHHPDIEEYRKTQIDKTKNAHLTNTTSTITNDMPSAGEKSVPPEFLSTVDPKFKPTDAKPGNIEHMTGETQSSTSEAASEKELEVGEMEGIEVKISPLRREGEDPATMRARLLYQSRKRGILETDLLLSTFAASNLGVMTPAQLRQYDHFLDENDWDIYYWATQSPADAPTSAETAEGGPKMPSKKTTASTNTSASDQEPIIWSPGSDSKVEEWAQTIGKFKPAYRPVPTRWVNSEILKMIRDHVQERSAGGDTPVVDSKGQEATNSSPAKGAGLGRMPEVQVFDQ